MTNASDPICPRCNKAVNGGEFTTVLDVVYHVPCFNCDHCNENLMSGFHNNNGRFYCHTCYVSYLPKCANCKKVISFGRCVKALDSEWHVKCFVCTVCKKPFEGGRYFDLEGKPYCLQHYWPAKAKLEKTTSTAATKEPQNQGVKDDSKTSQFAKSGSKSNATV